MTYNDTFRMISFKVIAID